MVQRRQWFESGGRSSPKAGGVTYLPKDTIATDGRWCCLRRPVTRSNSFTRGAGNGMQTSPARIAKKTSAHRRRLAAEPSRRHLVVPQGRAGRATTNTHPSPCSPKRSRYLTTTHAKQTCCAGSIAYKQLCFTASINRPFTRRATIDRAIPTARTASERAHLFARCCARCLRS